MVDGVMECISRLEGKITFDCPEKESSKILSHREHQHVPTKIMRDMRYPHMISQYFSYHSLKLADDGSVNVCHFDPLSCCIFLSIVSIFGTGKHRRN